MKGPFSQLAIIWDCNSVVPEQKRPRYYEMFCPCFKSGGKMIAMGRYESLADLFAQHWFHERLA